MNVFLSWSGYRSREIAESLREWLPDVLHIVTPWMSTSDIERGRNFTQDLREALERSNFGILCLTKDNCRNPWVLFEAGALAKVIDISFVCPYLIDMEPRELPDPLSQFQAVSADENGTYELIRTINDASQLVKLSETQLRRSFDRWWSDFKPKLESKAKSVGPASEIDYFFIVNEKTGEYLQATGPKNRNGSTTEFATYTGDNRQIWSLHKVEQGYYALKSFYTENCLDVEGKSHREGVKVHQWEFHGGDNQMWAADLQKNGTYKIRCKLSSCYLSLNQDGYLTQMRENGSRSQRWWLVPALEKVAG